jgi:kynureninase
MIEAAVAALGAGPLTEQALALHIAPLFSRHRLRYGDTIYLANHSLGRPLDRTEDDVREALAAWYGKLGDAWEEWRAALDGHRMRLARLTRAPRDDCIVPKTSAGQGLRAVLNTYDEPPRVVATRGEFDSLDVILREYARRGRIVLRFVEPAADGRFASDDIEREVARGTDLLVVSEVMFGSGQRIVDLGRLVSAAHVAGARVLVDIYHSLGVFDVDLRALDADFAVGGSYKYLRGGPGACFLYVHPRHLDAGLRTLDIGWFAKREPFAYVRPDPPELAPGGDAFMESTPPVLTYYQAAAGQVLALSLGVARIREHSLAMQRQLVSLLAARSVDAIGGTEDRGAFVVVRHAHAVAIASELAAIGVVTDARGEFLRLCPDILTTSDELLRAADALAQCARATL